MLRALEFRVVSRDTRHSSIFDPALLNLVRSDRRGSTGFLATLRLARVNRHRTLIISSVIGVVGSIYLSSSGRVTSFARNEEKISPLYDGAIHRKVMIANFIEIYLFICRFKSDRGEIGNTCRKHFTTMSE